MTLGSLADSISKCIAVGAFVAVVAISEEAAGHSRRPRRALSLPAAPAIAVAVILVVIVIPVSAAPAATPAVIIVEVVVIPVAPAPTLASAVVVVVVTVLIVIVVAGAAQVREVTNKNERDYRSDDGTAVAGDNKLDRR